MGRKSYVHIFIEVDYRFIRWLWSRLLMRIYSMALDSIIRMKRVDLASFVDGSSQ